MKKRTKKAALAGLAGLALLTLTACGTSKITDTNSGAWETVVYGFAQIIHFLSFNSSIAIGIIIFTLLIRLVLLPLMNIQIKSSQKMQEIQPEIKKIQAKYPGKDVESRRAMQEETQRLYSENKVSPYTGCLPLLVQMPVLWALYQALTRVNILQGDFLWLNIGEKDPYFILPILAAVFTFVSSYMTMKAAPERNGMTTSMTILMPIMIFIFALNVASGVALYWVVSNAFQVGQTMVLANPYKIIAAREAKVQAVVDKEKAREKAIKKAKKKK